MKGIRLRFRGTIGLIVVAGCTLGAAALVVWAGCSRSPSPAEGTASLPSAASAPSAAASPAPHGTSSTPGDQNLARTLPSKVIAFYFHRTLRCHSCLAIEKLAWQVMETGFLDAMGEGKLEWRALNLDEAENAHFERDFELITQSLVLAKVRGSQTIEWKNLADVWNLLDNPAEFERYVRDEVAAYLK